jgi:hypothetical protein
MTWSGSLRRTDSAQAATKCPRCDNRRDAPVSGRMGGWVPGGRAPSTAPSGAASCSGPDSRFYRRADSPNRSAIWAESSGLIEGGRRRHTRRQVHRELSQRRSAASGGVGQSDPLLYTVVQRREIGEGGEASQRLAPDSILEGQAPQVNVAGRGDPRRLFAIFCGCRRGTFRTVSGGRSQGHRVIQIVSLALPATFAGVAAVGAIP